MAITVFDGVAKFSADSSQLDQFIVRLEQGLTGASEKAAAATAELKDAQDELRAALRAVSADGGDTAENMERLAAAEKQLTLAAAAAKQEHAALKAELLGTKEASTIAGGAFDELGGSLAKMFGILALAEGFKALIEGTQQSILGLQLLSEKTGIAIDTLAGLEHESKANGISFEMVSTALTRLSRSQALAIEGGVQQVMAFQRIGISVSELRSLSPEELFYRVAGAMADAKNHAEQNATAFALLGRGGAALIPIFNQSSEALRAHIEEAAKASGVTREAGLAALEWERNTANLSEAFRSGMIPVMELLIPVMKGVETGASALWADLKDLGVAIGGLFVALFDGAKGFGSIAVDIMEGNMSQLVADAKTMGGDFTNNWHTSMQLWKEDNRQTAEFIKNVWAESSPLKPIADDLSDLTDKNKNAVEQQKALAKSSLDQQLADIEQWKAGMHLAYASGQSDVASWKAAELQAVHAASVAHEDYLEKLVAIYTKAGQAEKAHAAEQELSAFKTKDEAKATEDLAVAEEKHRAAVAKVLAEYNKMIDAGVTKEFHATEQAAKELAKAEEELSKAQTKLAEDKLSQHYKDQEQAITKLAQMHLITEQQKDDRLAVLEQQQATAAIKILDDELKHEQKLRDDAQAKLNAAKSNPLTTSSELTLLEAELTKEVTAVTRAEDAKLQAQEKFNKQSEANDKTHYGKALLEAESFGHELLAEQLKQNHAALLAAQAEMALAKARGQDTTAIEQKVKALKQHEQALEKEAAGNKQILAAELQLHQAQLLAAKEMLAEAKARDLDTTAINRQIAALQKLIAEEKQGAQQTKQNIDVMQELGTTTRSAAQTMMTSFATATQAMITGQESFGKAMEKATLQMLGQMAQHWAEYFLALAIGNTFVDPAAAAEEYAAAAALEVIAGALSGLASGGAASAATVANPVSTTGGSSTVSSGGPTTVNVPKLAAGGLASMPTLVVIGDKADGGGASEGILPLEDSGAMSKIASTIVSHLFAVPLPAPRYDAAATHALLPPSALAAATAAPTRGSAPAFDDDTVSRFADRVTAQMQAGGDTHFHNHAPPINMKGSVSSDARMLAKELNRQVKKNMVHLRSSDSFRRTPRSQ